jgi:6-pyruvoyltetrahydropterin/6-carboxytetrahydropterin synthase
MMYASRRARFSASHRLFNPGFSDAENLRVFGSCANPHGHGHDYEIEVTVKGAPDPATGMFINLRELKDLIVRHVIAPAEHRSLNHDVPWMAGLVPTAENVALGVWRTLEPHLPSGSLHRVRVRESENNVVEYDGPETA